MEFKGTKGEWYVINNIVTSQEQDICTVDIYLEAYMDIENAKQEIICKANAQLIANSPKLLEALQQAIEMCDKIQFPTEQELKDFVKLGKQVINQATKID
jgi:hypothetical protein